MTKTNEGIMLPPLATSKAQNIRKDWERVMTSKPVYGAQSRLLASPTLKEEAVQS
jgi:hypothetical protein